MKKVKKLIALALAFCLITTLFASCSSNKEGADGEKVTLKFVFGGVGKMKDSEEVWKTFNEELKNYMPNTEVEFEVIPYSEFSEKWKLMSSAREPVDLVWMGWTTPLVDEVAKGSVMPLDDLIENYTTDLKEELPQWVFDLGKVDGKTYCVPCYQMMTNLPYGAKTQAELAEEFNLDTELITKTFDKEEFITRADFKPFEDYLKALKDAGKLQKGVAPSFLTSMGRTIGRLNQFGSTIVANAIIDIRDPELKVYDAIEDFDDMGYYDMARDWYQAGYIRKDIMSLQDRTADENKENGYVLWSHSTFKGDSERQTAKYGFPILSIPMLQRLYISHNVPSTNTAISATSEHPEEAIKLLELLNTKKGKDLYNMLVFGIEGKNYNKVSENKIEWLEASAPGTTIDNNYGYDAWAIGNTFNAYQTQFDTEGWNEYIRDEVNGKATPSPLIGFQLDTEPIKLEIAQYNAIEKEYEYLYWGATENYKELIAERNAKFKEAGSKKIVAEVQRQIDEWVASQK